MYLCMQIPQLLPNSNSLWNELVQNQYKIMWVENNLDVFSFYVHADILMDVVS
jgi:hypothetical protein